MIMRAYISGCIKAVTPFHVPKSTVVFPRHPRIAQALCNHQDALRQWAAKHHVVVRLSNAMPPKQRHTTRRRFGFSFPVWPVTGKGDQRQQWRNLFPGKSLHVGTIPPSLGITACH